MRVPTRFAVITALRQQTNGQREDSEMMMVMMVIVMMMMLTARSASISRASALSSNTQHDN